jgi:hypothetical protein
MAGTTDELARDTIAHQRNHSDYRNRHRASRHAADRLAGDQHRLNTVHPAISCAR